MTRDEARGILAEAIRHDGSLDECEQSYVFWLPEGKHVALDGAFSAEYLQALVVWMTPEETQS